MFAILLLACHVTGEWVEIAQNHYRKEPSRRVTLNIQDSAANKIYANYSITERPWNRGFVTRIPNPGSIKRVHKPNGSKDPFYSTNLYEDDFSTEPTKLNNKKQFTSVGSTRAPNVIRTRNSETINNKRDRDATRKFNEPEKILDKGKNIDKNINAKLHTPSLDFIQPDTKVNRITVSRTVHGARKGTVEEKYKEINTLNENDKTKTTVPLQKNLNFKSATKVHTIEFTDLVQNLYPDIGKHQKIDNKVNSVITKTDSVSNVGKLSPIDVTGQNRIKINTHEINEISKLIHHKEKYEKAKEETSKANEENQSQERVDNVMNKKYTDQDSFENEDGLLHNESKSNPIKVIWKMMKLVTDNISRNTRRSFKSKVKYLKGLENTILSNIEDRIEQAWPDEGRAGRAKRSARGHVEFPSSESALMTISFLTFAVFLIKLVLQVIHTYKNKTMMVTPAVVAAVGRAAATLTKTPDN